MTKTLRGGNSRLLARLLDQLEQPCAVLDRKGVIVFVNARLCAMANADATLLVGKQCSWQIAADDSPFASILTALAPPARALQGKIVSRQLTTPVVFGSTASGQLFFPLLDEDGSVHANLVLLGSWEEIQRQLPLVENPPLESRRQQDRALVHIRSRWSTLDGLHMLLGESPAIRLAMSRAQLAIAHPCNLLVSGPRYVGKTDLIRGLFAARLKKAGLQKVAGQLFPVACGLLDADLLGGMLDVFAGRMRSDMPSPAQLLMLENVEELTSAGVRLLNAWLEVRGPECSVAAVSQCASEELAARDDDWKRFISRIATLEIVVPDLRSRREDIPLLANQLLAAVCQRKGRVPLTFSSEAMQLLTAYTWPENLAQLTHAVEEGVKHAVLTSTIQASHLPLAVRTFPGTAESTQTSAAIEPIDLDDVLLDLERIMLQRALKLSPRNRAQAARWLGISRSRLLRRIAQLGLTTPSPQSDAEET